MGQNILTSSSGLRPGRADDAQAPRNAQERARAHRRLTVTAGRRATAACLPVWLC